MYCNEMSTASGWLEEDERALESWKGERVVAPSTVWLLLQHTTICNTGHSGRKVEGN